MGDLHNIYAVDAGTHELICSHKVTNFDPRNVDFDLWKGQRLSFNLELSTCQNSPQQ